MNGWVSLLLNVGIGSLIGGVTNELAIRMLFRPFKPWKIGKLRVPFTPGLIPRRHAELATQMGRMVEEHLLTREGLREAIAKGDMQQTLAHWLQASAKRVLEEDKTTRDLLCRFVPGALGEDGRWSEFVREPIYRQWEKWADQWLMEAKDKQLRQLIPGEALDKLDELIDTFGGLIIARFRDYIFSEEGQQQVQDMLKSVIGGGGGMLGGFIGMFLGDDKIVGKILPYLDQMLGNPELAKKISQFIRQEADKFLDKPVEDVLNWLGEEKIRGWKQQIFQKFEDESLRFIDKPISQLVGDFQTTIFEKWIPAAAAWLVNMLENNVDRLLDNLSIKDIVAKRVAGFPLERVEEMILGISGKEFRMITVLGFILGGIIGFVQGIINILS